MNILALAIFMKFYETVCNRAEKWIGCCPIEVVPDQFSLACALLRTMRCHEAMQVIKTWTNSWATSGRYHENPIFPCLFGCRDRQSFFGMIRSPLPILVSDFGVCPPGDFSHYLICPKMWHAIDSIVTHSVPIDPFKRLGLTDSTYDNLFPLACSFHSYHAIKHVRNSPYSSLDFTSNSRLFAGAFIAAAHIVGLQYSRDFVDAGGAG